MKTLAPKWLDLAEMMADTGMKPADLAKYLDVTERSVWRWMAEDTAPRAALLALWHVTPEGIQAVALDHGNGAMYERGYVLSMEATTARLQAQNHRLEQELDRATLAAGVAVPANCPVFRTG